MKIFIARTWEDLRRGDLPFQRQIPQLDMHEWQFLAGWLEYRKEREWNQSISQVPFALLFHWDRTSYFVTGAFWDSNLNGRMRSSGTLLAPKPGGAFREFSPKETTSLPERKNWQGQTRWALQAGQCFRHSFTVVQDSDLPEKARTAVTQSPVPLTDPSQILGQVTPASKQQFWRWRKYWKWLRLDWKLNLISTSYIHHLQHWKHEGEVPFCSHPMVAAERRECMKTLHSDREGQRTHKACVWSWCLLLGEASLWRFEGKWLKNYVCVDSMFLYVFGTWTTYFWNKSLDVRFWGQNSSLTGKLALMSRHSFLTHSLEWKLLPREGIHDCKFRTSGLEIPHF